MNSVCLHYHVTWELSFLWVSSTPQICVKPNARQRPSMPLLFFLASQTKAVGIYLLVFINLTLQCIKFLLASLLKECAIFLAVHSVTNKTFTSMRNVEGKHGAVLDAAQSCGQKYSLLTWCEFCMCCVHKPTEIPFLLAKQCMAAKDAVLFLQCGAPPHCSLSSPSLFLCISWCRNCWKGIQ